MCSSDREFTVIRLNAFENCLCIESSPPLSWVHFSNYDDDDDNHAKLELCPKIKLNKSLLFPLSCHRFPFHSPSLVATTIIILFIYLWQQTEEKYFHDFPHRWYFVVGRRQQKIEEECCCEPKKASMKLPSYFIFYCLAFFYCSLSNLLLVLHDVIIWLVMMTIFFSHILLVALLD